MPPEDPNVAHWYDEHVRPHESRVRAWIVARFPTISDPDDLLQESRLRLLRAYAAGKIVDTRAYFFTTVRNAALDLFRRRRLAAMETLAGLDHVPDREADVAEIVSRTQEVEIPYDAIRSLPKRCREIMLLKQVYNLSNREICERLGISINTVNAQIVIGLMRCRRYLRDRGVLRGQA